MTGNAAKVQDEAVRREWREAVSDGNTLLAQAIEWANPDLFPVNAPEAQEEK